MYRSIPLLFAMIGLTHPLARTSAQTPSAVEQRIQAERAGQVDRNAVPNEQQLAQLKSNLDDPSEEVRSDAVTRLRLLARRVNRSGGQRTQRGDLTEPKVAGLVPFLLKAAEDEVEMVRLQALYALADTLDPVAVAKLRERLGDKSEKVRCAAACLLTEFHDASGIEELKKAVKRISESTNEVDLLEAEMVLASMQRITGKRFGPIPPNPMIMSDSRKAEVASVQYHELLDAWVAWWDWTPPPK